MARTLQEYMNASSHLCGELFAGESITAERLRTLLIDQYPDWTEEERADAIELAVFVTHWAAVDLDLTVARALEAAQSLANGYSETASALYAAADELTGRFGLKAETSRTKVLEQHFGAFLKDRNKDAGD